MSSLFFPHLDERSPSYPILVLPRSAFWRPPYWSYLILFLLIPLGALGLFGAPPWEAWVWNQLGLTLLAQALALWAAERTLRYPGREVYGVAFFYLALATLLLMAVFLLLRLPYARSFFLLSLLLGALPFFLLVRTLPAPRLLLLPGRKTRWLALALRDHLVLVDQPSQADGVVVDLEDPPKGPGGRWEALLKASLLEGRPLFLPEEVYEAVTGRLPLELGEREVLRALSAWRPGPYLFWKRIFELGLVILLLPLVLLVVSGVALLVYLDLGRPVLFAQERMGYRGRPFKAYKFRTMRGAPRSGVYAGEEKDRITPLGRLLRRFRLDELPQIWNVLRGEMALIGPRPEQHVLAQAYAQENPLYALRHAVPPGLTGWAQVEQGYMEGKEGAFAKLAYDLYYIKHLSFFMDLRILLKTVWVILTGFGAR